MTDRYLVTVERIIGIDPIPGADAIEVALVRGWKVVVRKGEFGKGQIVLFFEIDTMLPVTDERFSFLAPRGTKHIDGQDYHVLRTAKLRGQYSQGLVLPFESFPELGKAEQWEVGEDATKPLGLAKYEPPIPANLAGKLIGPFPTRLIPKTDTERVQNLPASNLAQLNPDHWIPTEKIDGTSITFLNVDGVPRICSRNWEMTWNPDSTPVKVATLDNLIPEPGWAIQAELHGEGIQGNPLRLNGQWLAVFSVCKLIAGRFQPLGRDAWPSRFRRFAAPAYQFDLPRTAEAILDQVDGLKSLVSPSRLAEGVVWHNLDAEGDNFKAISNKYLVKHAL